MEPEKQVKETSQHIHIVFTKKSKVPKTPSPEPMTWKLFLYTIEPKDELKIDVEVTPMDRQDQHTLSALIDSGATTNFIY